MRAELLHGALCGEVISAFHTVYGELGYGFSESVYTRALALELYQRRLPVAREVSLGVRYKGVSVGTFRADLLVADTVVVAVRTGQELAEWERFQLLNHMRCSGKELGLLLHFGPRAVARRVVATAGVSVTETLGASS